MASTTAPIHVQIVLFDGFDPLDAIAPFEVLTAAELAAPGSFVVELATVDGPRPVMSGAGIVIPATATLDASVADIVVVPGAAGPLGDPLADEVDPSSIPALIGATLATDLPAQLARVLQRPGAILVGVCGGSLIPAMAGLIEGRPAVTHHLGMDVLEATGALAVRARVVDDGELITGGGVTSGLDVALHLVDRFVGPQVALAVEDLFEFERRGVVWRAGGRRPVGRSGETDRAEVA